MGKLCLVEVDLVEKSGSLGFESLIQLTKLVVHLENSFHGHFSILNFRNKQKVILRCQI